MEKQELHDILIAMLNTFVRLCKDNDIKYFLAYGSHLGAIRHKGFIPWDDDIDLFMLPEDIKKIRELNIDNELFFYQYKKSDKKYCLLFDKLLLKQSKSLIEEFDVIGDHNGIFIDIFPLYYVPANFFKRQYMFFLLFLMKYSNLIIVLSAKKYQKILSGKLSTIICKLFGIKNINEFVYMLQNKLLNIPKSNKVVDIELKPLRLFETAWFNKGTLHDFEKKQFIIPEHSEELLTLIYGDYLQLPNENERLGHADIEFIVSEEMLEKLENEV